MQSTAAFERDWREWGLGRPLHREMTFTEAGVLLGRGTLIAEFEKKGRAACGLALDGEEARIFSLLTATFAAPVAPQKRLKPERIDGSFGVLRAAGDIEKIRLMRADVMTGTCWR